MDRPRNAIELRMFIGCINYYRDMWPSCAHILKLLTDRSDLKTKAPINWTDQMQKAFGKNVFAYSCQCPHSIPRPQ